MRSGPARRLASADEDVVAQRAGAAEVLDQFPSRADLQSPSRHRPLGRGQHKLGKILEKVGGANPFELRLGERGGDVGVEAGRPARVHEFVREIGRGSRLARL